MVIVTNTYVCAVARSSLRGLLAGRQNPPVNKLVKCLDFYDKPYVREYVATGATIITWRTDFPQPYGSKRRGSRNPLTKLYRQKSLYDYAVGRPKAINLANGEGRIDDEEGPGGWDGADVHKNENQQQPMLWIPDHAVLFNSADSLATYGQIQWPTTQGIGTISITRQDALKHSEIVVATCEHKGDSPFVGNYQHIFLAEPRRVKNWSMESLLMILGTPPLLRLD